MGSRDIASPSSRIFSCPRFLLASDLIWIIAFKFQKKISSLILFSFLIRSSPSLVDQLHTLDLVWVHLGSLWSRNFITQIPQGLHIIHFSIGILRSRNTLVKAYPPTLGQGILIAVLREPITLLLKQVSYLIESLLWIGFRNHSLSDHWSIHHCDSS